MRDTKTTNKRTERVRRIFIDALKKILPSSDVEPVIKKARESHDLGPPFFEDEDN